MQRAILLLLVLAATAGCVDEADPVITPPALEVYRFDYPGALTFVEDGGDTSQGGAKHGLLWRLVNNGSDVLAITATLDGADGESYVAGQKLGSEALTLQPGTSRAFMLLVDAYTGDSASITWHAGTSNVTDTWTIARVPAQQAVAAGHEVHTVTVGVWQNGTAFYTNSPELLGDPGFPAGGNIVLDDAVAAARPLPVYVYGQDRSEQPGGSKDRCFFTTITGYNALLKTQALHSTGARHLAPEEAYTRPGAEGHLLYGDALIFLNTVVRHDGSLSPQETAPDPTAPCFDAMNHVPDAPILALA